MEIYLVGGAVRDQLLGYPIKERDYVVVGATPEQMLAKGFLLVGKNFPVFLHPKTHEEYALARTERKIGPGYKGFSCYAAPDVTLEADLQRRDLTINAIAQTHTGKIIDPYGGQQDIAKRILRHIAPAFVEDPVRILRVARFMASFAHLGFHIAPETMQLMKVMVERGEVNALVPERVWQEFSLALTKPTPQAFIKTLFDCGALAILFPLLQKLLIDSTRTANQGEKKKLSSLATFNYAVALTPDPEVRFAALFCHLGNDLYARTEKTGIPSIQHLCRSYRVPTSYYSLAILTARYHLIAHRALDLDAENLLSLLEKTDAFRKHDRFQQFLLVCEADFHAYPGLNLNPYFQKDKILAALSAAKDISITDLTTKGLTGKIVGEKLRQLRIDAIKKLII